MRSSRKAIDLIITSEIGSSEQYERSYAAPTWPGGKSGVTVGIGYDLGYASRDQIGKDFEGLLPPASVLAMQNVAGMTGSNAAVALMTVKTKVRVPWDVAIKVFISTDVPRYEAALIRACPRAVELPADCFGALLSIVYNRGPGGFHSDGDRFKEMRNIARCIDVGEFARIPAEIRSMKRLWGADQRGLLIRRDREAKLFEQGLINGGSPPPFLNKDKVTPEGSDVNVQPEKAAYDVRIETLQRSLRAIGYHEVGEIDGRMGGKTRGAATAFMNDRGKDPDGGVMSQALIDEINKAMAEGWSRPISPKRANATAKDLSGKVASVDQTWWQKLWAFILGIPSAGAAIFKSLFGDQTSIGDYIDPVKNFFAAIPPELYFLVVAAIALAIFIQAKRAQDATVKAYQRGEIN